MICVLAAAAVFSYITGHVAIKEPLLARSCVEEPVVGTWRYTVDGIICSSNAKASHYLSNTYREHA
jgi:hypothetical protein